MSNPTNQKIMLIGWHAAGWDVITPLLDDGELPNLAQVVEHGLMGSMTSMGPLMEPMVYTSLATGKYPARHGIFGTHEVCDNGLSAGSITSRSRRAKAFWEILSQNDVRCDVVNFPTAAPAEQVNGTFVGCEFFARPRTSSWSPVHVPEDSVQPIDMAATLQEYLVALEDLDPPTVALFVPRMSELSFRDSRLAQIATAIAQTLSVHMVATWLMENTDWRVMAVNYPAIEVLSRQFLQYHPPRLDWVDEEEFDLFNSVVSSSVRLCDLLLGRLLQLGGERATTIVYSPRAYASHRQLPPVPVRPGPREEARWHRPQGIFAMRADGTRQDELIHGVRETDLCPTVLALSGIAVPDDMDGRVLTDAFAEPLPELQTIETWETCEPTRPQLPADMQLPHWTEMMTFTTTYDHRGALGVRMQNDWNQAEACRNSSRPDIAVPLMTRLYYVTPFWLNMVPLVAETLYQNGLADEALTVMRNFSAVQSEAPLGKFMAGIIAQDEGRAYEALDLFEEAAKDSPPIPQLYYYLGEAHQRMGRAERAMECFDRAVEIDPNCIPARIGRIQAHREAKDYEAAGEEALNILAIDFSYVPAHYLLGMCLEDLGQFEQAKAAYANILDVDSDNQKAKGRLEALQSGEERQAVRDEEEVPAAVTRWSVDELRTLADRARQEVAAWASNFIQCFHQADEQLDAYLAENARQLADQAEQAPGVGPAGSDMPKLKDKGVLIRPIMPADLWQLGQLANRVLTEHHRHDVFVLHREGESRLIGVLSLRTSDDTGERLVLMAHPTSMTEAAEAGLDEDTTRLMLIRAGVARAAAGKVKRVSYSFPPQDQERLAERLEQLGFQVSKRETVLEMNMAATRDRCLRLVERYTQRGAIPDNVKVVSLKDVAVHDVDKFLKGFFDDGIGPGRLSLNEDLSLVILHDQEIIAAYTGFVQGETWVSPRLAVLEEYQSGWATPMLVGRGAEAGYNAGLRMIQLYADETVFPEMIRIGRRTGGEEKAQSWMMTLNLVAPWPESDVKES